MKYFLILITALLFSCAKGEKISFENFENEAFKTDRSACLEKRTQFTNVLKSQKDLFLGKTENDVFATLGRYDYQILDRKNEKIFIYFLEKGAQCENIQNETSANRLVLYFNSVSLVKEVTFQTTNP